MVVVKQAVEGLKNLSGGQIQLVQDDPEPPPQRLYQEALLETDPAVFTGGVGSHVLLDVRVLVVVDADTTIASFRSEVRDKGRLARRRRTLQQDGRRVIRNRPGDVLEPCPHSGSHDEPSVRRLLLFLKIPGVDPESLKFHRLSPGGQPRSNDATGVLARQNFLGKLGDRLPGINAELGRE